MNIAHLGLWDFVRATTEYYARNGYILVGHELLARDSPGAPGSTIWPKPLADYGSFHGELPGKGFCGLWRDQIR